MKQVAVIQMVSQPDVAANLMAAARLLHQARAQGAELAVLPENFATFGCGEQCAFALAEAQGSGPLRPWLRAIARDTGLWILAGTLPLLAEGAQDGKPFAASLLVDDAGVEVARYDKLHLFAAQVNDARGRYREADDFAAGAAICVADTPLGRIGLTVCYDLRFAPLYAALRAAGAELIAAPSAFTAVTGAAHWEVLVRARAIESQCLLLAAAQGGDHGNGRHTHGEAMIVDAWGRVLARAGQGEAVLLAPFDRAAQLAVRQRMPVTEHCRFSPGTLQSSEE